MRKVLVIGLGNPDRGDDGAGALAVSRLVGRLPADVVTLVRSGDMLSLIEEWTGFDDVVCVDAAAPMGKPGRIHRIDLAAGDLPREMSCTSSHAFGLAEAVALARALGRAPRNLIVIAIEGYCFDDGTEMTPAVAVAADGAAEQIVAEIGRLRKSAKERPCHA
jgi:hydrogenase maturation protease